MRIFDSVKGEVIGRSGRGTFVNLNNGVTGWIKNRFVQNGEQVLCSVYKISDSDFVILNLDSVMYSEMA